MHLRMFGCKCYVHNNGKDALGKFDPKSDEAIFLGYSSHSKAYKVFNKRTLCVEESVHVLFDVINSLVKHDAQDEEYELGLERKDFLLTQNSMEDKGKTPEGEPSPRADIVEDGQGAALSNLIWNRTGPLNPTLPKLIWEQASEHIQYMFHQVFRGEWKAYLWICLLCDLQSTRVRTSLIKFYLTLIQECKPDLNSKTFVLSICFSI